MKKIKSGKTAKSNREHNDPLFTELNENPGLLKRLADASPAIIYVLDFEKQEFVYINQQVNNLLGQDEANIFSQGKNFFRNLIHPEDYEKWVRYLESLQGMEDSDVSILELRMLVKNEGYRWFRIRDRIFKRNESGQAIQSIGLAHDIHKSRLAIQETAKFNDWFNSILENSPVAIMALKAVRNKKGKITDLEYLFSNRKALESVGRTDLTGKLILKEFPEVRNSGLFENYVNVIETGISWSGEIHYDQDGLDNWTHISANKLEDGCLINYYDITDEKNAEKALKENKNLLQSVFDTSFNGIVVVKKVEAENGELADLEYVLANKAAVDYLGQDLAGKRFLELFPSNKESNLFARYREVFETGESSVSDHFDERDGSKNWLRNTAVKVGDYLVIGFQDITEQKSTEERNKAYHRQLKSLNTELKTLNTIVSTHYNDTLKLLYTSLEYIATNDAQGLSNSGRGNIRRAQAAIQKMKLLTEDILSYTRLQDTELLETPFDLDQLVRNIAADFASRFEQLNADLQCDHLPLVNGYPTLVSLLFRHLIENSIKFRHDGRSLDIRITCREFVSSEEPGHESDQHGTKYHVVSVADNGMGFENAQAQTIFGIFNRLHEKTKYKGSGIGLAICKKIMDMHGGFIIADGKPDQGACFHCYFPSAGKP
jgi:PAS domain S-box-containing protein